MKEPLFLNLALTSFAINHQAHQAVVSQRRLELMLTKFIKHSPQSYVIKQGKTVSKFRQQVAEVSKTVFDDNTFPELIFCP